MERKSFLDQEPPPGYIPGIGRGATGFVTQADLGSSKKVPILAFQKTSNDGRFDDSEESLTPILTLNQKEDIEADKIYDEIEKYLEKNRNKRRKHNTATTPDNERDNEKVKVENKSVSNSIAEISEQFQDVKQGLSTVSVEEWANLPESGDFTRRNKRLRNELQEQQRFYRNSDMIALALKDQGATDIALDEANAEIENRIDNNDNDNTNGDDDNVDLFKLAKTKDRLLENQIKLGISSKLTSGIDKNEYLGLLDPHKSQYNIGDYKRTRKLFAKLRETSPSNPKNWIASARLEFDAKKLKRAKELIQEGCEKCPKSEEIWLTNLEMNANDVQTSKVIVADAIKFNYKSLKLWLKATELELDNLSKVRVLRKALEWLPKSFELWLAIVDYEDDKEIAIRMLEKATSIIPNSLDLWMKLSSLKEGKESIKVLIDSIQHIAKEKHYLVWINVSKIEEKTTMNEVKISRYINKAFESINCDINVEWYKQAETCENEGLKWTCRAIILKALETDTNEVSKLLESAESHYSLGHLEISNSIYTFMTSKYPQDLATWKQYLIMKKKLKDYNNLFLIYEMAVSSLPNIVELYIMYSNDKIKYDQDFVKVRDILSDGLDKNSKSEQLWFYAIDFESRFGSLDIARDLFTDCLKAIDNPSVELWIKKAGLERKLNDYESALSTISGSLIVYPNENLLYQEKSDILTKLDEVEESVTTLQQGISNCNKNELLYVSLAALYEKKRNNVIKARSILDESLSLHPKSDILHHARIKLELDANNKTHAQRLLSKAITLIPTSALLWVDNIKLATKQQVKNTYVLALKKTNDDPLIILTIAKDLWKSGRIAKSNQFFKACLDKDDEFGDFYIYYYAFLLKFGTREEMKNLEDEMLNKEKLHGYLWGKVSKENEARNVPDLQLLREAAVDLSKSF